MDTRVTHALQQIELRFHEPLEVRQLAAEVNLSPSRFAHLFRIEIGIPPMRHLQAVRLSRARDLVAHTSLSIHDVMVQVGYHDPSHFARDFRRYHGVSPRELRTAGRRHPRPREPERRGDEDYTGERLSTSTSHQPK